jgi:hypothetical protein
MSETLCDFCNEVQIYTGANATTNYLPDALRSVMYRQNLKSGEILRCPACNRAYFFDERTPGGSDDAMTTTYYQDFYPLTGEELSALESKYAG